VAASALRILLAEDNPANQKLAAYILQDRGHAIEIAADGQQAIRMAEENRYDVILMDVQMPGTGGLEATKAIRAREQDGRRVPIIAMTAHVLKGDREQCLAAGMDAYLSKPIDGHEMISLVESLAKEGRGIRDWGLEEGNQPTTADSPNLIPNPQSLIPSSPQFLIPPSPPIFDAKLALERCFHQPEMVRDMIRCFFSEVDNLFPQMRTALEKGDLPEVGRLGHRLKGTVVYLGAEPARAAAFAVENFETQGGEPAEAVEAVNRLAQQCQLLKAALAEHRRPAAE
jgi:CheY-like chemotaxis protein